MQRFDIIHNIPSPYRLHLFRRLDEVLKGRGYSLTVHMMARGHADRRYWGPSAPEGVKTRYWRDWGVRIRGKPWHFNPGLLGYLVLHPPAVLLVGGPWDTPTGALASILHNAPRSIGWFEGNTKTPGILDGPIGAMKRMLLGKYDAWAVPGQEGAALARAIAGDALQRRIVLLPNIVDEERLRPELLASLRDGSRGDLGIAPETRVALLPARLIWEKGIVRFLRWLPVEALEGWVLLILGDGPDLAEVGKVVDERSLGGHVRVLPPVHSPEMPRFYAAADLILLPSVWDPNPLVVVETLHSGLPLFASDRIGNLPEAIEEAVNGWSFDPDAPVDDLIRKARTVLAAPKEQLVRMGAASKKRGERFWSSVDVVERFADQVLGS